jgi:DNA repair protein RadA/Sms
MGKPKRRYVCQACGSVSFRWQGQCADCAEWNTLVEDAPETVFSAKHDLSGGGRPIAFEPLNAPGQALQRRTTGLAEFDRALGGGLVPGSAILMGGDPGIGKSTLLLQAAAKVAQAGSEAVYISGEEAVGQVRLRAERMGLADAPIRLATASPRSAPWRRRRCSSSIRSRRCIRTRSKARRARSARSAAAPSS